MTDATPGHGPTVRLWVLRGAPWISVAWPPGGPPQQGMPVPTIREVASAVRSLLAGMAGAPIPADDEVPIYECAWDGARRRCSTFWMRFYPEYGDFAVAVDAALPGVLGR